MLLYDGILSKSFQATIYDIQWIDYKGSEWETAPVWHQHSGFIIRRIVSLKTVWKP